MDLAPTRAAAEPRRREATISLRDSELKIPRLKVAPQLEDFLAMLPDKRFAGKMAHVKTFVQRYPNDGQATSEKTEVYLGYGAKRLYLVWVCWDDHPQLVRARMAAREDVAGDDRVEVLLDAFHDQRRGYAFATNPLGVQWDATYTEGRGSDPSFDTVWDSRGKLTGSGYVVWMAIPLESLRFPPDSQQPWGVVLVRRIPRNNESSYWPRVSSAVSGILRQEGEMSSPHAVSPGRNFQVNPYLLAGGHRAIHAQDPSAPAWEKAFTGTGGMDAKAVIKDRLVVDATVNPDFSQVPIEDPQVTANQRYEVYYPELRPFFLENANYFSTPFALVFTRRIEAPTAGARLTGKLGRWAIGALMTDDKEPGQAVAISEPSHGRHAQWSVFRVSRDLGQQSTLGVIYLDHQSAGESNQVGGLDGLFRWDDNWSASFQAVQSSTTNANGNATRDPAYQGNISRAGRSLGFGAGYSDVGAEFQDDLGYIQRTDVGKKNAWVSYRFHPEEGGGFLQQWGPDFSYYDDYDHTGLLLDRHYKGSLSWDLKGQTSFGWECSEGMEQLRPRDFSALASNQIYPEYSSGFWSEFGYWEKVSFGGSYNWQQRINYYPEAGNPFSGNGNRGHVWVTIRPSNNLRIDNSYVLDMMHTLADKDVLVDAGQPLNAGHAIYENHILESKWSLQLNQALSIRFVANYKALLASEALSDTQTTKEFTANVLLSYMLHPGTAMYVGYNSDLQNLNPQLLVNRNNDILRTPDGFINDGRQFFVKIAYLFRL